MKIQDMINYFTTDPKTWTTPIIRDVQVNKKILEEAFQLYSTHGTRCVVELNEKTAKPYKLNINGNYYNCETHAFDTLEELARFVYYYNVIIIYVPTYGKEHLIESFRPIIDRYVIRIYVKD